jgi:hypothetical protein
MDRLVVDVVTGQSHIVSFTAEAEAAFLASVEPAPVPPVPPTLADLQAQLTALQAQITALAPPEA